MTSSISGAALSVTAWVFVLCAAVIMIRLIRGPLAADRLTALSAISALILAVLVIMGARKKMAAFLDVGLVYAILGFLGILAIASYTKDGREESRAMPPAEYDDEAEGLDPCSGAEPKGQASLKLDANAKEAGANVRPTE